MRDELSLQHSWLVWYMTALMVLQVIDPSHVPFSHHGVQGDRFNVRPVPDSPPAIITVM